VTIRRQIDQWLVLSPLRSPTKLDILDRPFLRNEARVAPARGDRVGRLAWQAVGAPDGRLDFLALRPAVTEYCAAYACVYLRPRRPCAARLVFGADDGLAVWLNGRKVISHEVQRPCTLGDDVAEVRLAAGWNRMLCKVSQYIGQWEMRAVVESAQEIELALAGGPGRKTGRGPLFEDTDGAAGITVDGGTCELSRMVYHAGAESLRAAPVKLLGEGGSVIAEEAADGGPFSLVQVRVKAPTRKVAAAMAASELAMEIGGVRFAAGGNYGPLHMALAVCDPSEQAGAELHLLSQCFHPSATELADRARQYLAAWASGNQQAAFQALRRLNTEIAEKTPDRKGETVHVVGHAHIDMNWLWTWPETVQTCHDTFRQVIAFMEEFPDFAFLQSQASTYQAIERIDPALFERIRARVKEGRWELAGGMVSEGDTNMSSGEALARTFLLCQRYFLAKFGKCACVGWLPDNFGHAAQFPQILRLAGCEFFYFHRCQPYLGTFWWEAPDGSRVLAYANRTYNGQVTSAVADSLRDVAPDTGRMLNVCGVGDHGGGPTRADIETAHALDRTPRFPAVKWTTAEAFLRTSLAQHPERPVHKGEMQYIFEGCYTTIARVKEGNRRCEAALYTAELLSSLRRLAGDPYPADTLRRAWETVAFNQFHDILCGSAIHASNAESVAAYITARKSADEVRDQALRRLADEVKTGTGRGQPVVVFNPAPRARRALIEAEVFSHDLPATATLGSWASGYTAVQAVAPRNNAATPSVRLRDSRGKALPAQIVGGKNFPPGWRSRVQFAADLPAGGYDTFYVDPGSSGEFTEPIAEKAGTFETERFTVGFDMQRGTIRQLLDKRTGRELARGGRGLNALRVWLEEPHGMSGWYIGPTPRVEDVTAVESVRITERGPVRACVETVSRWGRSKFVQRAYVYRSYPRIDFELDAHWFEQGDERTPAPMLRAVFPLALRNPRFVCHTPFAAVERPTNGQEVPAQRWVDVSDGAAGVALLNRTKYGHSFEGGELRLTRLRSSYVPDIYPDQGLHHIAYSLFPHAGDWREGVWDEADAYNVPPLGLEPPSRALGSGAATRPESAPLLSLEPAAVVLSGVKQTEEGDGLVVRVAETAGEACSARIAFPQAVTAARRLDLLERPLSGAASPRVDGQTVVVDVKPHEIVTLGLQFG